MPCRRFFALTIAFAACTFDSGGLGDGGDDRTESGSTSAGATTQPGPTTSANTSSNPDTSTSTTSSPSTTDPSSSEHGSTSVATTDSDDASTSTSTGGDEPPAFGPWDEPIAIDVLNSDAFDDDPTLRADLCEIYFSSTRSGGPGEEEIWRSTRPTADDEWAAPELVAELNTPAQDGWPELSHDGLVLTFASNFGGPPGAFDLYLVTREDLDEPWGQITPITALNTPAGEASAVLSADGLEVLLMRPVSDTAQLMRATRADALADFDPAAEIVELNSKGRDTVPFLDVSGTRVLFASDRGGSLALFTATREDDGPFGMPEPITELDGDGYEDDPWWAPDGSVLYYAAEVPGRQLDIHFAMQAP